MHIEAAEAHLPEAPGLSLREGRGLQHAHPFKHLPQKSGLHRRIWLDLENQSGEWAQAFDRVWVITGPVTHPALAELKENLAERERRPKERSVLGDGLADHGEDLLGVRKLYRLKTADWRSL